MSAKKALIYGAGGQTGHYLAEALAEAGLEPVKIRRSEMGPSGDVGDSRAVEALIMEHRPGYIFHLAAHSTTRHEALFENHAAISTGTLNILEAVRRHCPEARVFITGSGVQFQRDGNPVSERSPFLGDSAYAVARIHSAYAARYFRTLGIQAYVGYLFHHESPLRPPHHVSQKVVQAARRVAAGTQETLELGDLSVRKEWTFAGDVARGILALVQQDRVFEAAIGSGLGHTIQEWVEVCFGRLGLDWRAYVKTIPGFKAEYSTLISDPSTIKALGWAPSLGIQDLADLMLAAPPPAS